MSAGDDSAPPSAQSSPPPPAMDDTPSNVSSPLSDVEDRDADTEDVDLDMRVEGTSHDTPKRNGTTADDAESAAASDTDDSKLSEVDVNDSEAETERLYDTPRKNSAARAIVNPAGGRRFTDRRDRGFQPSPSKLQQQLKADGDAEEIASGHNTGTEAEQEDGDDISAAYTDTDDDGGKKAQPPRSSPTLVKKSQPVSSADTPAPQASRKNSADSRKRKRSLVTEQSDSEQPLKKRSPGEVPDRELDAEDVPMADDDGVSTNPQSGEHTTEEDDNEVTTEAKEEELPDQTEEETAPSKSKKGKKSPKKKKSKSPEESVAPEEAPDEPPEEADTQSLEVPTPTEDDQAEIVDEDVEAAQRNEEECMERGSLARSLAATNDTAVERKKAAWDELVAIEKQFSSFRERLYQERLEQLNQEEAMLTSDPPTHPEYLAMLQCLEERRQEKIRQSALELQFKLAVLRRRAVAERAQIMAQFYQAVRESREKALEELGQEWYEIQQERRRAATTVPDYSLHFPSTRAQAIRNAVAYNKEVSILSGFAKHVGFPAAPPINGISEDEAEADLELIKSAREPAPSRPPMHHHHHHHHHNHQPTHPGFRPDYAASLSYDKGLGPAGEQFIEQTPWANPNHPVHRQQQQQQQQAGHHPQPTYAPSGPGSAVPRRPPNYPSGSGGMYAPPPPPPNGGYNGDSAPTAHMPKAHHPTAAGPDAYKAAKPGIAPEPLRREPAIHAS